MKILRLRLNNLNSLRGAHEIDFTRPPFAGSGLFAITGPTGAGKSTLLDAITLALYGRAARYGTQRSPETVMSRHTGECSAEVEFSCAAGVFRSVWQLRRARKNPIGELQQPRRRVIELPGETVLCEKIDQSENKIIELTGLDYDRFLRSVLLAQGDFAAFLKASAKDRTDLLQLVTGTAIYQDISRAAYRECEATRAAHAQLLARHEALPLLSDAQRVDHQQQREALNTRIAATTATLQTIAERLGQAQRWLEYETNSRQLALDQAALAAELSSAAPELKRLTLHEHAANFATDLAAFDQLGREQSQAETRIRELNAGAPELERNLLHAETIHGQAKVALHTEEARQEANRFIWDAVDEIDSSIVAARESDFQATRQRTLADQSASAASLTHTLAVNEQTKLEGDFVAASTWLREHSIDASLGEKRVKLEAAFAHWSSAEQQHRSSLRSLAEAQSEVDRLALLARDAQEKQGPLEAELASRKKTLQEAQEVLLGLSTENIEVSRDAAQQRRSRLEKLAEISINLCELTSTLKVKRHEANQLTEAFTKQAADCALHKQYLAEAEKLSEARQTSLSFAERLQSLEEHRAALIPGGPCPLCGATEHPFASPETPLPAELAAARRDFFLANQSVRNSREALSQTEKSYSHVQAERKRVAADISRLENERTAAEALWQNGAKQIGLECSFGDTGILAALLAEARTEEIRLVQQIADARAADIRLREASDIAQQALSTLERQSATLTTHRALLSQATARMPLLQTELIKSEQAAQSAKELFATQIVPFAPVPANYADAATALEGLKIRTDKFVQHQAATDQLKAALGTQRARAEALSQQVTATRATADAALVQENSTRNRLGRLEEARRMKFGVQPVAKARQEAAAALKSINEMLETARASAELHRSAHAATAQEKAGLDKAVAVRSSELQAIRVRLTGPAIAIGFADFEAIRAALLPSDEKNSLLSRRRILEERRISIESRAMVLETLRGQHLPLSVSDAQNFTGLQIEKEHLEGAQTELHRAFGAIDESLRNDDALRAQQAGIAVEIEAAYREFLRWDRLRALIGSADGSAFARFAQGLTLERLVNLANHHLDQLSPRYRIRRAVGAATEDLELEIVDHFQAGIARPMRSLSGGESFLASLALALGLSELASGSTTIESIFIDEGFGTLDAETLETAMDALENLQARGKTIGVISHVAAMKERICNQIRVLKESAGCSRIEVSS